jgi:hypothetical protein
MKQKLEKLRLILDADFDPQGVSQAELIRNLNNVVSQAAKNGTLTGDTPATVESYGFKVLVRRGKRQSVKHCKKVRLPAQSSWPLLRHHYNGGNSSPTYETGC